MTCGACGKDCLDIDVKCPHCGAALGATGAHRMLGTVMLGVYELVDVLGQGGMSVVFKGRHKMTEQEVALKILPPELAAHSQVKSRFLEEAKALAALDHPNIVHLYNFGQENGYFVLAMQYVAGRTWERMILENKRLDWAVSCRIAIDVLRALEYAHGRGVVHRDMKPSNVLVRAHDGMATVMDFGIAKMTTSTRLTATGQTMGTVRYMSPEQVRGQEVDFKTDIYSLGATLYESLTGETPFDGSTHFEIMTKHLSEPPVRPSKRGIELPEIVEEALMRSLAKRAEDRFESARDMRKQLESALKDSDLGLVETQRLSRQVLGEARRATPLVTPRAASTARPLADELEPGTGRAPKQRRLLPYLALAVILLGGGAATVFVVMRGKPGYDAKIAIHGVTIAGGTKIGNVIVETDGKVEPTEVANLYKSTVDALHLFAKDKNPRLAIADPIEQIVAVPRAAMCEPTAYPDSNPPKDCASAQAVTTFAPNGAKRLMIVSDRTTLIPGMRRGVAQATCLFANPDDKTSKDICDVTSRFAESSN